MGVVKSARNKAEGDLDSGSNKEAMTRAEKPEQNPSRSDAPAESKEQKKENALESKNAEGKSAENFSANKFEMTQEVKDALKTEKDTAYFWSGLGPNGQNIAKEKAVAAGGTTLENQLEKNRIDMPEWSFNDKNSQKAWNDVSACYAENCSGEVKVLAGKIREGSIFESTEYNKLVENKNVSSISLVNAETGDKQTIYDRDKPENNAQKVVYEENGQRYIRFDKGVESDNETNRH